MSSVENRNGFNIRALLESTNTPFTVVSYAPHAVLFMQGDSSITVMYVEDGTVQLAVTTDSGREAICGVLAAGAFLGMGALRGERARRQTAAAMTSVTAVVISADDLQHLLRSQSTLFDLFIEFVLARQAILEADLTDQIINASEQRLARTLLRLADCNVGDGRRHALPQISQESLAQMVGTTRSRVNAFMSKFRRLGLLENDCGVLLVHPSLRRIARGAAPPA
jgi:CRP-like cAMP-binding protein